MISTTEIQALVAHSYGLTVDDLRGPSRARRIVHPRHEAMLLARLLGRRSYPHIGRQFGNRDHSTVIEGCRKAWDRLEAEA